CNSAPVPVQQRIEGACGVQGLKVIAAADVALADEDLGHRAAAAAADHLRALVRLRLDVYFPHRHALGGEQRTRTLAIRAPGSRINEHRICRHGSRLRLLPRERQMLGAPGAESPAQVEDLREALR